MPEWTLPSAATSVALARRLATEGLRGVPTDTVDVVALVVSELVTNCIRHAHTDFDLKVTHFADRVDIEVTDRGRGRPALKSPPPSVAHGRGLQVVQSLSARWGVVPAGSGAGKTVWCTVPV